MGICRGLGFLTVRYGKGLGLGTLLLDGVVFVLVLGLVAFRMRTTEGGFCTDATGEIIDRLLSQEGIWDKDGYFYRECSRPGGVFESHCPRAPAQCVPQSEVLGGGP